MENENQGQPDAQYAASQESSTTPEISEEKSMKYAGFLVRVVAYFIDGLVLAVPGMIVSVLFGSAILISSNTLPPAASDNAAFIAQTLNLTVSGVIGLLYFSLMESSSKQGTLGKIALGLKVVDMQGNRITFGRALGRYLGKIINSFTFGIGYLMIAFSEKKQGLHDKIASTYVINLK